MGTLDFPLKVKSVASDGSFVGFGSTYNNRDLVGDRILPGSFQQSIQSQGAGYPLLFCHDSSQPLGIAKISDSKSGLVVEGQMLMSDPNAQRVNAFMKMNVIKGLSIGFSTPDPAKISYDADGTRILREIKLYEISLTPIPANPLAVVTAIKSLSQVEQFMETIRRKAAPQDAETTSRLQAIHEHVLALLGYPDDDPDEDDDEDDYIDEDEAKALLAELKSLVVA